VITFLSQYFTERSVKERRAAMTTTYHRTMTVDGLAIFYREAGPVRAPTVVLLHGFPTSSPMFRHLSPALSETFHVVAPDYPSFGSSAMPTVEEFAYTFDHLADVIDGFVQQLGLATYSLSVMDDGAPVGFRLAAKHPERVQALIVQHGNAYAERLGAFWHPFRAYWQGRTAKNAAPLHTFLTLEATKWQYTHGVRSAEAIRPDNWLVDQYCQDRPANKAIQLQLVDDYDANPPRYPQWHAYLCASQPPTLVVWGKHDPIFPAPGAHPYTRDLHTIAFHLLDTGHFALEEDGEVIARHMRHLLTKYVRPVQ
jgi:pimeloyl-ACP methyl ester carboxylesterase